VRSDAGHEQVHTPIFRRHPNNPILRASDWLTAVNAVFNPSAAYVNGETVLLARVEDRQGLSSLHVARSSDGYSGWRIDPTPAMTPMENDHNSAWGFEDARSVWVDELERFVVTCTAYGPAGPAVHLSLTRDFNEFEHYGIVMPPEDKNAALFPRRIGESWVLLHRPVTVTGHTADVWLSRSSDLVSWRAPEHVMGCRTGGWWDGARIGIGPPPIETDRGWLVLYHGVKTTVAGQIYRVGAVLLDLERPSVLLRRTSSWLLSPEEPYERIGDVPNVVFPCGIVQRPGGELWMYYGAADTSICLAITTVGELLDALDHPTASPTEGKLR
jgi:predicted GH43/DUF377 family glycosyl hydrolase